MNPVVKNVDDLRAAQDIGAAIFIKRPEDTLYHLWLPVTDMPATGSAPATADATTTTSRVNVQTAARKSIDQKEFTFFAHRDNFRTIAKDYNQQRDFLQINPDGTGWKFSGQVSMYQDSTSVNNNMTAKAVITVSSAEELPRENVLDIIQDTVTFSNSLPATLIISGTGKETISVSTDPTDATVTVESSATTVATAAIADGVLTVTGVKKGSSIVTIKASKSDLYAGETTILVIVE